MASQEDRQRASEMHDRIQSGILEDVEYVIVFICDGDPKPDPARAQHRFHVVIYERIAHCPIQIDCDVPLTKDQRLTRVEIRMTTGSRYQACLFARVQSGEY